MEAGSLKDTLLHPINTYRTFRQGVRYDYRPQDRRLLQQIGNKQVTGLIVGRKPIFEFINSILNVLSFGNWKQGMKQYGYDKFFHLFIRVFYIDDTGKIKSIKIEKNEVITISEFEFSKNKDDEYMQLNIHNINLTINQLLNNTRNMMGDTLYFSYNPFTNNCQNFILNMLRANNILQQNPDAQAFIYQDKISEIIKNVNPLAQKFSTSVTDTLHQANILTEGAGI